MRADALVVEKQDIPLGFFAMENVFFFQLGMHV